MKEKKEKKESKGGEKRYQPLNNFKIALSAMLLDKDFKTAGITVFKLNGGESESTSWSKIEQRYFLTAIFMFLNSTMHTLTLVLSLAAFVSWLTFKVPMAEVATGVLPMQLCFQAWIAEIWRTAAWQCIRRVMFHATVLFLWTFHLAYVKFFQPVYDCMLTLWLFTIT
eukprot:5997837-Ditylum_brightwellii.AAC.1